MKTSRSEYQAQAAIIAGLQNVRTARIAKRSEKMPRAFYVQVILSAAVLFSPLILASQFI